MEQFFFSITINFSSCYLQSEDEDSDGFDDEEDSDWDEDEDAEFPEFNIDGHP